MSKHRSLVQSFGNLLEGYNSSSEEMRQSGVISNELPDREFISEVLIHSSDLSSPTKPWEIS
jgi:hypothetical protein